MPRRSLDDVVDEIGSGFGQYALVSCAGEVLSGLVKTLMSLGIYDLVEAKGFTSFQRGMLFSIVFCGNGIGNASSGFIGDTFGRRVSVMCGNFGVSIGLGALYASSLEFPVFLACNGCIGIGIGLMGPACWTLIGEVSPAADRLWLSGVAHASWYFGASLILMLMCCKFPIILASLIVSIIHNVCSYVFILESPSLLVRTKGHEHAVSVLQVLRDRNGRVEVNCDDWEDMEPPSNHVSFAGLFQRRLLFVTVACCFIIVTANYSTYGMLYLLPSLLPHNDVLVNAVSNACGLFTVTCTMVFGHRIDRKLLLTGSLGLASVSGVMVAMSLESGSTVFKTAIICVNVGALSVVFFGGYLYVVEVVGTGSRASSAALAMTFGRLAAASSPLAREYLRDDARFILVTVGLQLLSMLFVTGLMVEPNMRQLSSLAGETAALTSKGSK